MRSEHRTRCVRSFSAALASVVALLALASAVGDADAVHTVLPAPVTITAGKATFRIARDGQLGRAVATPLPFPRDAAWFPGTGSWFAIRHRHVVIGQWGKTLWRSRGEFPSRLDFNLAIVRGRSIAFAYGQRLYVAQVGSAEHLVAGGEFPIGWTSGGFFTYRFHGRQVLLRDDAGALVKTVARRPLEYPYDGSIQSLYFIADGAVMRATGTVTQRVVSLARLGLVADSSLMMQPLGGLLELLEGRRLVVLRPDGSVFATTLVPRERGIDSGVAIAPGGRAVAFSTSYMVRAASPDPARGAIDLETVYVLRAGARTATPLHTERVQFAPCLGGANVAWHARWLLFSAGEGSLTLIDTAGRRNVIDFTPVTRKLVGVSNGFGAYWGRRQPLN